jgi:hypothetical protein
VHTSPGSVWRLVCHYSCHRTASLLLMFLLACIRPNTTEGSAEQEVVLPTATATAHDGRVTALLPMPNGLSWLSAATDSRVRLWSVPHFRSGFVVIPSSAVHNFPLLRT